MDRRTAADIDEYISCFPDDVRKILTEIRATITKAAPKAVESISYHIPTFKIDGTVLIYFAGFKNHVSIYPVPREAKEFAKELADYKGGKGTLQLPLGKAVSYDLISRIVRFRIKGSDIRPR